MYHTLTPIKKPCDIIAQNSGLLSIEDIETYINIYIYYVGISSLKNNKFFTSDEYKKKIMELKMELIIRNILLYDKNVYDLIADYELINFIKTKIYLLTQYFINDEFIESVINCYI